MLQSLIDTDDLDDIKFREIVSDYLPLIEERGESLNDFMRRFADVVRLPDPKFEKVDLVELLEKQATIAKPVCDAARVELKLLLKSAKVLGDQALIQQVVINAIANARESIGEGGIIQLSCEGQSFSVADNGPGITETSQNEIFTPFFSTKPTGQGIGLTLTRDVLERHGASYSLMTEEDGWTRLRVVF